MPKLNKRGKIAVSILFFGLLVVFMLLAGMSQKVKSQEEESTISPESLKTVSFTYDSMDKFEDSQLNQSMIKQSERKEEKAKQKAMKKQQKKDQRDKAIYLTFDDGPSEVSGQLLDILDEYDADATFFMLGPNMKEHQDVVKRMADEDFGLGLHGITHDKEEVYRDTTAPYEEMSEGQKILEDLTGVHSKLIRLPYGSVPYLTADMRAKLHDHDFRIWDWNVDSRDWEQKEDSFVQETIKHMDQAEEAGEAPVVLLHDKPETLEYLPALLKYVQKQGYKTKALTNDMTPVTFQCEGRCHPI